MKKHIRRRPCRHKCVGGRACALESDPSCQHQQCVCNDPSCVCHTSAAYGLEKVTVRGVTQYRPVRWLEVPR